MMWMIELPPFVPFFIGSILTLVTRGYLRAIIMLLIPVLGGLHLWMIPEGSHWQTVFLGYELLPYRVDKLSLIFGYIFHIAAFISIVYALHVKDTIQQTMSMLYAGSALGAVFAGDLLTLFIFWELLAASSVFLIWASRTEKSYSAGLRYLVVQVLSGVILLAGALFYAQENDSLLFEAIELAGVAGWLIFIAFGIKCAFPFFHTWLTDAYPEATPTGTVFLSAFTTKVAVYALARGYPGTELLVYIGAAMTCFPIFFAVIENDLRRVLAFSMINQIGFMVCGIGIGSSLAINGAVSHAFNDIIFKGLLFMSMGAVLHRTGIINGSQLGGLYKSMPKTTTLCIIGAASISAFPLFSGFVSKSMVMSAALTNGYEWVWAMMLFASAGVFHHAGIKIPYFAFFAHDSGIRTTEAPTNMLIAMAMSACLCITIGVYPQILYQLLPYDTGYNPYDATHVLAQTQLLFFSALAFVWLNLRGLYPPELRSVNLDADWFYRRLIPKILTPTYMVILRIDAQIRSRFMRYFRYVISYISHHHGPDGLLSRTRPTGNTVMWITVILSCYMAFSFIYAK
jgi:multicomponent Na+:H+ antiporter subunit D